MMRLCFVCVVLVYVESVCVPCTCGRVVLCFFVCVSVCACCHLKVCVCSVCWQVCDSVWRVFVCLLLCLWFIV